MTARWDVIVVGGGIVGLSTGYALKRGGAARVLLLERHVVGGETTGRGTGAVQVHRFSRPDLESVVRSKAIMDEIAHVVGPAFRYHQVGRVTVASGADADDLRDLIPLAEECGVPVEVLSAERAQTVVPGIDVSDADLTTYSRLDGRIYSNTLAAALAGIARDAGLTIWEGVDTSSLARAEDGSVTGVVVGVDDPIQLAAGAVVVAAGAWTRNFLDRSNLRFPTRKRIARTMTVLVESSAGCEPVPTFMDTAHQLTYIPRNPEIMQLGGHNAGITIPVEAEFIQENAVLSAAQLRAGFDAMRACLVSRLPGWRFGPILGGWSGLIDVSPDGQPLIGPYPGVEGLWVNDTAGYGLMRALGTGEAIADTILGREPRFDVSPWRMERLTTMEAPDESVQQSSNPFRGIGTATPNFTDSER